MELWLVSKVVVIFEGAQIVVRTAEGDSRALVRRRDYTDGLY